MEPLYKKNPSISIHLDNNDFVINYESRHPLINLPKSRKINPVTTVTVDSGKRWKLEYWTQQVQPGHNFGIWAPFEGEPRRQGPMNHTLVNLYPYPPLSFSLTLSRSYHQRHLPTLSSRLSMSASRSFSSFRFAHPRCPRRFLICSSTPAILARMFARAVQGSRPSKCTLLF